MLEKRTRFKHRYGPYGSNKSCQGSDSRVEDRLTRENYPCQYLGRIYPMDDLWNHYWIFPMVHIRKMEPDCFHSALIWAKIYPGIWAICYMRAINGPKPCPGTQEETFELTLSELQLTKRRMTFCARMVVPPWPHEDGNLGNVTLFMKLFRIYIEVACL